MKNIGKIYIIVIVVLLLIVLLLDMGRPKQQQWDETYSWNGTYPHDLQILYKELPKARDWDTVMTVSSSFYEWINSENYDSTTADYVVLYIGNNIALDKTSEKALNKFVEKGNDAFIFAKRGVLYFNDTSTFQWLYNSYLMDDTVHQYLHGVPATYTLNKTFSESFPYVDSGIVLESLGYSYNANTQDTINNYISIQWGAGRYFLHGAPIVFTNFHLLKGSTAYVNKVFSVSKKRKLIILSKEVFDRADRHLFEFIFSNKSLTWAWYLSLITLGLYILFYAKRRQQVIPIHEPLQNTTQQFVETVGNMYKKSGNYTSIAHKRIIYFQEYIRSKYHIDSSIPEAQYIYFIAARSGVPAEQVSILITTIHQFRTLQYISKNDFIHLDRLIEQFKNDEQQLQSIT